ncbi:MAG: HAD family phosphatase [Anaerolineae bacterium]|jgi:epoxide hydrolase-like predicted phosphatase
MTFKAVIFDFGGVILALPDEAHREGWARRLGLSREALTEALWGENWRAFERGQIDDETYHRRMGRALGLPDQETVERFLTEFYADEQPFPQMLDLIGRLRKAARVKLGLLTNAFVGQDQVARRKWGLDLRAIFDVYVNSAEVGLAKPDPAIYELTLARLGVSPGEAIFIDDGEVNVQAAAQLGMHAIHMDSPQALETVISQIERLVL